VDILAVEAAGFRRCDFRHKITAEVLVKDAIRCGKEGKDLGCAFLFFIPVPAGRHFSESAEFRGISGFRRNTRRN